MAGKLTSGFAAAIGSFVGLLAGGIAGTALGKGKTTFAVATVLGTAGGAFAGAALATPSSAALAGQGTAGLPAGVGRQASQPSSLSSAQLLAYLRSHGCDCSFTMQDLTRAFQIDWNANKYAKAGASAMPLAVDGEYGPNTQRALWAATGAVAPNACYFNGVGPCDGKPRAPVYQRAQTFGNTPSLPRPVAPVPHKCTARSANTIAQQIPGGPWTYQHSLPPGTPLPTMATGFYDVVTPQGPKNIPAKFSGSSMVLVCPTSHELFVFMSTPS